MEKHKNSDGWYAVGNSTFNPDVVDGKSHDQLKKILTTVHPDIVEMLSKVVVQPKKK